MYRDLGFLRVWGGQAAGPVGRTRAATSRGVPYAYLIYPHKPIVAYLPQTGRLLNEYCVEFPDETRPYGSPRLPDSDDVLAKWMALKGDERRLIAEANLHLPGRQVDPRQVQRDLWRLGRWERERLAPRASAARRERARRAARPRAARADGRRRRRLAAAMAATSTSSTAPASSPRAPTAPPPAPSSRASASTTRRSPSRSSASPTTWTETMPCNFHLRALAAKVKEGIRAAGGTPMEFNTIAISDGITMGTSGMRTSLVSPRGDRRLDRARRRAATSSTRSSCLAACDKTIPGTVMALARLDVPGVMLYGGSILPGHYKGEDVTILEVFEAVGAHAAGQDHRRRS